MSHTHTHLHPLGCPALVVNLWDVTDRDIDRFCEALLGCWLGGKGAAAAGASGTTSGPAEGRQAAAAPSGKQARGGGTAAAAAKRGAAAGAGAGAIESGGSGGASSSSALGLRRPMTISAAVSGSRSACKLTHLIGAAPVCYGIPTQVLWGGQ
jgi:separase